MQQIGESNSSVQPLDDMEQQTMIRIEEAEELIEQNRRLIERSREILASAPELPAGPGKAKQPDLKAARAKTFTDKPSSAAPSRHGIRGNR
ncbi:hypothetical protein [Mesorhizobium sp. WSM3859]|uniref:hypothetical protein n=1 Tax=Mesorhizobium sp. WSM3859 TaxID=2029402 RepID=UPI000BC9CD8C|nr:hypothetical protein [Mesorhizobium sp. WSM3859]PBC06444.1 hypothetical protein CK230_31835 [Mesorhizobium sp. WSM3859]